VNIRDKLEELESAIREGMAGTDQAMLDLVRETLDREDEEEAAWQLERDRLTGLHGADSPLVERAARRLEALAHSRGELRGELERLSTRPPARDLEGTVIHGRVVDPRGIGIAGLRIAALNERDARIAEGRTEAGGEFVLKLEAIERPSYRLEVRDSRGARLHRDAELETAVRGEVVYREVAANVEKPPSPPPHTKRAVLARRRT
jgi:hypothetical protein